jgi:hypothetical protein
MILIMVDLKVTLAVLFDLAILTQGFEGFM